VPSIEASGPLNGYWEGCVGGLTLVVPAEECDALGDESIDGGRFQSCHSD
jgi:hypothetical protein